MVSEHRRGQHRRQCVAIVSGEEQTAVRRHRPTPTGCDRPAAPTRFAPRVISTAYRRWTRSIRIRTS